MNHRWNQFVRGSNKLTSLVLSAILAGTPVFAADQNKDNNQASRTSTPIKHLVVIFQENVSFDHYFATYPNATNPAGEPRFVASQDTPSVNGLTPELINLNQNSTKPFRLDRTQAATCDQGHGYTQEQQAFNFGLMNKFPEFTGAGAPCDPAQVMGYFDGNTVTAFWNYAQRFAMSDNSFNTTFGPSSPGALNLVAGQTSGAKDGNAPGHPLVVNVDYVPAGNGLLTIIGDPQPAFDDCSTRETAEMTGSNVGNLLNAAGITWGFFQGGFKPTGRSASGKAVCGATHTGSDGNPKGDYIPHHQPFQYYRSTANPHHLPPSSIASIGSTDQANHQYDISDFLDALNAGNLPEVIYLKAPGFQDGHAGYSDPLAEQTFIVDIINRLQQTKDWDSTAVIISYDDSDGWYDHAMSPIVMQSNSSADALSGPGTCGTAGPGQFQGRCGYGPRLPLLVISPLARVNFVDHSVTDQSSILRFIEDNWELGRLGDQSFDE